MTDRNLDVSKLPEHAFGYHSLTWWGTAGFIAVEATFFAVLIATYLYGVGRVPEWPPGAITPLPLGWGTLNTAILLIALIPNVLYLRAAKQQNAAKAKLGLALATLLGTAFLVVRVMEFSVLNVRWDENFYGSIVWVMLGFHTLHFVADFIECVVLTILAFRRPIDVKRFSDFVDDAMYWFFVTIVWLLLYALIYLFPRWV